MLKALGKALVLLIVVLLIFLWVGWKITSMTGGERGPTGPVEINPEGGETVFWGKGRCYTCHSIGDRGSAVRGPNLGIFGDKFPLVIGERAAERAKERSAKTGLNYAPVDYIVESLGDPGAYIVDSYKNEMAIVYAPPISLNIDEVKAVISYLQSQGGDVDIDAINMPTDITKKYYNRILASSAVGGGDPKHGAEVFEENCMECHIVQGEGENIGPDLSAVGKKGVKFLQKAILRPSNFITPGYETYIVIRKDGRKFEGLKTGDETEMIEITTVDGDIQIIARNDIRQINEEKGKSIMPSDLIEVLTVKDYQDLLSFLIMQKGQKR